MRNRSLSTPAGIGGAYIYSEEIVYRKYSVTKSFVLDNKDMLITMTFAATK